MSSAAAAFPRESDPRGRFVRQDSSFRGWVAERPEPGSHHLYVSLACPWASRIVLARRCKGLEDVLPMTVLDPLRDDAGWRFTTEEPDPVNGFGYLSEVYRATDPAYEMRVTVPVLWDRARGQIVNNESADLLRMLNGWSRQGPDLYPTAYRDEIDSVNDRVYRTVNNGVYRAGFASRQDAYEEAFAELFASLDWLEQRLGDHRYLVGPHLTEADIRLFVTLVRFDAVYVGHFKCNQRRIADYPALSGYLRDLYAHAGVAETVNFDHIKRHYYMTHPSINPTRIVPVGPELLLDAPHGREKLG